MDEYFFSGTLESQYNIIVYLAKPQLIGLVLDVEQWKTFSYYVLPYIAPTTMQ